MAILMEDVLVLPLLLALGHRALLLAPLAPLLLAALAASGNAEGRGGGATRPKWAAHHWKTIGKWWFNGILMDLPAGYVKIAMENHHFQWENPL